MTNFSIQSTFKQIHALFRIAKSCVSKLLAVKMIDTRLLGSTCGPAVAHQRLHSACWQQRQFDCAAGADRVILRFGAVDYAARVWVNGGLAPTHQGGHTPFSHRHHELARRLGRAGAHAARRGRSARPRQAPQQARRAKIAARHRVPARHRHLADGLVRAGLSNLSRPTLIDMTSARAAR